MKVITLSREYGAGGHSIGRKVAAELGIEFYDKDIFRETVKASGFDPDTINSEEEEISTADSILKTICNASSFFFSDTQNAIHEVQQAVIQHFAEMGPCVILGRCADDTLAKAGIDSFDVFIHADVIHRAQRVGEILGTQDINEIRKAISKKDTSRRNYYNHYTGKHWGDARNYDMCLNSGALGYDTCARMIVDAVKSLED